MLHAIQTRQGMSYVTTRVIADGNYGAVVKDIIDSLYGGSVCYYNDLDILHEYVELYLQGDSYYTKLTDGRTDLTLEEFESVCFPKGAGYYMDKDNTFCGAYDDTEFKIGITTIRVFEIDDTQAVLLGFPEFGLQVL